MDGQFWKIIGMKTSSNGKCFDKIVTFGRPSKNKIYIDRIFNKIQNISTVYHFRDEMVYKFRRNGK